MLSFEVTPSEHDLRLDQWLRGRFPGKGGAFYFGLFKKKQIKVNGKRQEASHRVQTADQIDLYIADLGPVRHKANDYSWNIIDESPDRWVVYKPEGLAVHPGAGLAPGQSLIEQITECAPPGSNPCLAHRLDQGTSGLLLVSLKASYLEEAHKALKKHILRKKYYAIVFGDPGQKGQIDCALELQAGRQGRQISSESGKKSLTHWLKKAQWEHSELGVLSLLEVEPWTGRMHQIRTHLQSIECPIVGDPRYGDFAKNAQARKILGTKRMFLHARELFGSSFGHWTCEPQGDFHELLQNFTPNPSSTLDS